MAIGTPYRPYNNDWFAYDSSRDSFSYEEALRQREEAVKFTAQEAMRRRVENQFERHASDALLYGMGAWTTRNETLVTGMLPEPRKEKPKSYKQELQEELNEWLK